MLYISQRKYFFKDVYSVTKSNLPTSGSDANVWMTYFFKQTKTRWISSCRMTVSDYQLYGV